MVNFSSAGSSDPEGQPLTYAWNFGDNTTSTAANPTHTYTTPGPYQVRLTVSDGVNSTISDPLTISAGNRPTVTILSPTDGATFRAGDVITFSGTATDAEDGTLPASAYTWNIDFLHDTHVHPGTPITGVTSGTFTIPTSGHDFSDFTRYRVSLTVTDSSGLQSTSSVTIFPQKVNLTFAAAPAGATVFLDGIAHTAPFVYDDADRLQPHHLKRPTRPSAATRTPSPHGPTVALRLTPSSCPQAAKPTPRTSIVAATTAPPAFVQVNAATPQTNQSSVAVTYTGAQTAGNTNILAIGWNNATSNITSVTDSAGNTYQLAVPTARGTGVSQAIYYAPNIKAAAAGTNTVTVTFNTATPYVDIRALEYSGLDPANPFDVGTSASGTGTSANSGTVTTTAANALIFGAGITTGGFSTAGTELHHPHHHHPRRRHRPRPHRHRGRRLQRHRTRERRLGHAGRHLQSGRAPAATPPHPRWPSPPPPEPSRAPSPHRHRHRQRRRGRGAVPGGQQRPGRRGHHLALQHHPGTPPRWPTAPTP